MRVPHTGTNRGKKVRIVLRNGEKVEGKFVDRTNRWVELDTGRVMKKDIRAFIILKGQDNGGTGPESRGVA